MNKLELKRLLDLHISAYPVPPPVLEFVLDEISRMLGNETKVTMMRIVPPDPSFARRHRQSNEK